MPRLIRDYTNSGKVDKLSPQAETFFARLMVKADDFGCYYGHATILLSNLFPLKVEVLTSADISAWTKECIDADLVLIYDSEGKTYIHIKNFGQRLRSKNRKFPEPPEYPQNEKLQSGANCLLEDEQNLNIELEQEQKRRKFVPPTLEMVISFFKEKNFPEAIARKAFEYYDTPNGDGKNWVDSRGHPVKNWKQKFIAVWMKDENRNYGQSKFTGNKQFDRSKVEAGILRNFGPQTSNNPDTSV